MAGLTAPGASRCHGGPDARGALRWDFSTNGNAAGPCPAVLARLREADPSRYPDPAYQALRERLAHWHGVAPQRVLLAASASEFIQRITAVGAWLAPGPVGVPRSAYGDYAQAARAWRRELTGSDDARATLRWVCEPSSPLGQDAPPPDRPGDAATVLDAVYAPLRLQGQRSWPAAARAHVFELHSPNKALGLTGVRGAYAIAPVGDSALPWIDALEAAAPSWPLGAHAVAMLTAWPDDEVQAWLAAQRETLRAWKTAQQALLRGLDCEYRESVAHFFCARLPAGVQPAGLREHGVAVRDATSFGLPGWVRLSVQPPEAQDALRRAVLAARRHRPP
ncbi:MAG TPA: aminotransferase class I/II-fold pyridoxal phosphate-dependent enzyme [Ideonella sp.]|nr:aminotransferase class I/II-fold pyridoxal phosphate-dependent enzyme [Ideonella sp.]